MNYYHTLRELRKNKGKTQQQIADMLNIGQRAYSSYEAGTTEPNMLSLKKLADYYNVTIDYIIGRQSFNVFTLPNVKPIEKRKFKVLGNIACGKPIYAEEEQELYVTANSEIKADFVLVAQGDSMINARIQNGDYVFIREQPKVENGEIGAIIIGEEATLKRVYWYPEKKKLVLQAENPKYEPLVYTGEEELEQIRILGKAVAFQSEL